MNMTVTSRQSAQPDANPPVGLLAEYETPKELIRAAKKVNEAGYKHWDAFTPFPVHHLDEAMGMPRTKLPYLVLGGGLTGMILGTLLTWYTNAGPVIEGLHSAFQAYPWVISGKPIWSFAANIPVIFEMTILLAAFGAVFGMLGLNQLPRLHHPLFKSERFRRATQDRFYIAIDSDDPNYDPQHTRGLLEESGAVVVEVIDAA